jgi:aconitate hydratase
MAADTLGTRRTIEAGGKRYDFYSIGAAEEAGLGPCGRLPVTRKILLENLLRHEDGKTVRVEDMKALIGRGTASSGGGEFAFRPARVLMQDFTGVPAVVDLAALRDAVREAGGDPEGVNPLVPVDLVIDHSVTVERYASEDAYRENVRVEMARNGERYALLRWAQGAFRSFRVVPPGSGICHQVNLEYLARTVWHEERDGVRMAYPDTLVGTDSHTPMVNGIGVLGWGVGGIEAEAVMLGHPVTMPVPEVVGVRLIGALAPGVTATDLVLTVTEMLRAHGVVGKFVEFHGPGLRALDAADRATVANMAPEYGATCGFFPVDGETVRYLRMSGRPAAVVSLVEAYAKEQGMWPGEGEAEYDELLELDLAAVVPSVAGPRRPQERVLVGGLKTATELLISESASRTEERGTESPAGRAGERGTESPVKNGDVVIAAITSCTNTSNPKVMLGAGLLAKKAVERGLTSKPWVKTSLAPGSKVVTRYLDAAGLTGPLRKLGFHLVGYGCTTCIGNSGPLREDITRAVTEHDPTVVAVLSGNRNFEGRIHPLARGDWLASPPLVVAYALAGTTLIDLTAEPLGSDPEGRLVYLRDIWPTEDEIEEHLGLVRQSMFEEEYGRIFEGGKEWEDLPVPEGGIYRWAPDSTYIKKPPYLAAAAAAEEGRAPVRGARILAMLGEAITTDHISPAGSIPPESPAGRYLQAEGVEPPEFNSYGSRRGNHEVMMRATFANIRLRNELTPGREGGYTRHYPDGEVSDIYGAAMRYREEGVPLVVIAGREYGTGSSRDWAAKGTVLLGVQVVIAESFERIHLSNLSRMGVLPLEFLAGENRKSLALEGSEVLDFGYEEGGLRPGGTVRVSAAREDGGTVSFDTLCRLDKESDLRYFLSGGILNYVLSEFLSGRS